ncbi:agamous-like MADS-box protein AGL36 [Lycium ferocissimum]|uniref:agamous-like MADS-box protein AGL36 n=1 Tax=Lycium ferocissimum TaxID=112874 RepID=UPI0028158E8D|nr:agamous-like MADS-box protein AGL36 [Lycium ferocissimum]
MARKRLRHTRNCSENARSSILDSRTASLFKKAEEFSTLCDVEVTIIIFSPGKIQPITWQSKGLAKDVVMRYLSIPEAERLKKLVQNETYLLEKMKKKEEQISKIEKINEEKEMELLFNQVVEGRSFYEFDTRQIKGLLKLSASKMAKLNEIKKQPIQPPNPPANNEHVTLPASLIEDLMNDPWFVETMAILGDGSGTEPAPTEGDDANAKDDGDAKDLN